MLERRKVRILMRGVKIGKKKGGEKVAVSNAFEKKSETKTGWINPFDWLKLIAAINLHRLLFINNKIWIYIYVHSII